MRDINDLVISVQDQPKVFALAPARPGSIRDSVSRAERFVNEYLLGGGRSLGKNDHVLIVGLGPTGMAIATTLLDQTEAKVTGFSFIVGQGESVLRNCKIRMICPTTFDFPAPRWHTGEYPYAAGPKPPSIYYGRDSAEKVFRTLRKRLTEAQLRCADVDRYQGHDPGCIYWLNFDGDRIEFNGEKISEKYTDDATVPLTREPDNATHLILCTGLGVQRVAFDFEDEQSNFESYGFWCNDDKMVNDPKTYYPLLVANRQKAGVPDAETINQKVLIIGTGDGGLADFVRLSTGQSDPMQTLIDMGFKRDELENRLITYRDLTDRYWRAFEEKMEDSDDPEKHQALLAIRTETVEFVDAVWGQVGDTIKNELLLPFEERPKAQLVVECCHFTTAYAANRLPAQLVARAIAERDHDEDGYLRPFRIGVKVSNIVSAVPAGIHTCRGERADCELHPHEVQFAAKPRCKTHCEDFMAWLLPRKHGEECIWKRTFTCSADREVFGRVLIRGGARDEGIDWTLPNGHYPTLPPSIEDFSAPDNRSEEIRDVISDYYSEPAK